MKNFAPIFLSQSYKDAWDDYIRSLSSDTFPVWDYIILTASNEDQAEGYRMQIEQRRDSLPSRTVFAVIPDEGGVRVGSGGATLSVLNYIYEEEKKKCGYGHFDHLRIMVIHSGGDSKRVPTYSALGKLFSPVPHKLPDGRASSLFDEFLIMMSSVPGKIREGMLLLSGDVLLLFNPLQIDFSGRGAAALSFKEHVETGKNHGVFLNGENNTVRKFLHKRTVENLTEVGAVNENHCVDIDTGAVIFSVEMLNALYSLVDTEEKYRAYVNDTVRLSLYGDFLYPLAEDSTLEDYYQEKPEGSFCPELQQARLVIWKTLRPFRLKLLRLAPAKFIHFGTTREILELMSGGTKEYESLSWSSQISSSIQGATAGYHSVLSGKAQIGEGCYLEVSYVHSQAVVGNHVLLSYIDIHDETIPDNVVLHGLKQKDQKFICRIYGTMDNPKETRLFGYELKQMISLLGIDMSDLWDTEEHILWTAKLYPECDTIQEAVSAALHIHHMFLGVMEDGTSKTSENEVKAWKESKRKSLCSGFGDADQKAIIAWDKRMRELVCMDEIAKNIRLQRPARESEKLLPLTKLQKEWLAKRLARNSFSEKIRLNYYIGTALGGKEGVPYITSCFRILSDTILQDTMGSIQYNDTCKIVVDRHMVKLPLRVNWGGGWSDTPPVCIELGGTVLNAAIRLKGELPVTATIIRIPEKKIVFDSRDMDVHGEFETIEPLQAIGDPYDPFALQKACLLACGVIPKEGGNLENILQRMGGGFELHSEVANVPKGSGLGTSSILSAACVKAVFEFLGIKFTEAELYSHVLAMEQIMSTGGGWQDQVGGVTDGIKFITSKPGLRQELHVEHVEISMETKAELNERFCLIYTGQRRLARNLLRDVIGRFVGNEPDSLYAMNEIQRVASLMRFELMRGNIDAFAQLLEQHWELSKKVDIGSTNTLIDQIFASIEPMIAGRLVCGAGGGGFLQVILKRGVTKERVHKLLKEVFQDNPVDVWDCELV